MPVRSDSAATVSLLIVLTIAPLGRVHAQSRQARRTAELEARIAAAPDAFQPYLDLARHQADNRLFADARATVMRAIDRLAAAASSTTSSWRSPSLTGDEPPPLPVGGSIRPPKKIKDVKMSFPARAQADRATGTVMLEVVVGFTGTVDELRVRRSDHPALEAAAIQAVSQWQFEPTIVDGTPARVVMPIVTTIYLYTEKPAPDSKLLDALRRRPDDLKPYFDLARFYLGRDRRTDLLQVLIGLRDALAKKMDARQ